jgi:iron-sulfur cluster assembly protein
MNTNAAHLPTPPVQVTPKAAEKVLALAKRDGRSPYLRLGVRGGGCSGLSYVWVFVEPPFEQEDFSWEIAGLTLVIDPKSAKILNGCVFDFDTHLIHGGFRFHNPNAQKTCSCGESFIPNRQ